MALPFLIPEFRRKKRRFLRYLQPEKSTFWKYWWYLNTTIFFCSTHLVHNAFLQAQAANAAIDAKILVGQAKYKIIMMCRRKSIFSTCNHGPWRDRRGICPPDCQNKKKIKWLWKCLFLLLVQKFKYFVMMDYQMV